MKNKGKSDENTQVQRQRGIYLNRNDIKFTPKLSFTLIYTS